MGKIRIDRQEMKNCWTKMAIVLWKFYRNYMQIHHLFNTRFNLLIIITVKRRIEFIVKILVTQRTKYREFLI